MSARPEGQRDVLETMLEAAHRFRIGPCRCVDTVEALRWHDRYCAMTDAREAVFNLMAAAQKQIEALQAGKGGISTAEHDADCGLRAALRACGADL